MNRTLQSCLKDLAARGLTDAVIARGLARHGVSERTVRRWRTERAPLQPGGRWDAIDDVRAVADCLLACLPDDESVVAWLRTRNVELGWERPIEALGAGRFDEVLALAQARRALGGRGRDAAEP